MNCSKRQTVMTPDGQLFRCLNRKCPAWGQEVTDEACNMCEFKVVKKETCKEARSKAMKEAPQKDRPKFNEDEVIERTPDGSPPPEYPNWSIQAWMYKEALLKWKRAGYPTRTQEEVDRIHEDHCTKCSWYDPEKKRCKGCGCRVTDGAVAVVNKIKMATEHCPREFW